jgi:hypothetical protein
MTALRHNDRIRWRCVPLLAAAGLWVGALAQTEPTDPPPDESASASRPSAAPDGTVPDSAGQAESAESAPAPAESAPEPAESVPAATTPVAEPPPGQLREVRQRLSSACRAASS